MRRLVTLGVAAVLGALVLLDGTSGSFGLAGWLLSTGAGVLAAVLVLRQHRLPARRLAAGAVVVAVTSALLTAAALDDGLVLPGAGWSLTETAGVTLLLSVLARRCSGRVDTGVMLALTAATVSAPLRIGGWDALVFSLLVALLAGASVTHGLLRRGDDLSTAAALLQVRNDERRDIARDLHDDLAHHVTGILVTAQAAAVVGDADPAAGARALRAIERSAGEALSSMRSLVQVLRDDDDGLPRSVQRWPGGLQELVERFGRVAGLDVRLTVSGPEPVPAHRQAVQRVVQEALTNVGRHATGATAVQVRVDSAATGLALRVRDDGQGRDGGFRPGGSRLGGGFGLAGVRERAAALGGTACAGPLPSGGWQVELALPPVRPDGS